MGDCLSVPDYEEARKYRDFASEFKTGDVILVSGNSPFSKIIKLGTMSKWTHVGMVIKLKVPIKLLNGTILGPEKPYILHSTADYMVGIPDLLEGRVSPGVQLNDLEDVLYYDEDKVYVRQIQGVELNVNYRVQKYMEDKKNTPYERNLIELINSAVGLNLEADDSSLFCSELVAELYYQFQVADENQNDYSNNYTPDSFSEEPRNEFIFKKGIKLGPTIKILR